MLPKELYSMEPILYPFQLNLQRLTLDPPSFIQSWLWTQCCNIEFLLSQHLYVSVRRYIESLTSMELLDIGLWIDEYAAGKRLSELSDDVEAILMTYTLLVANAEGATFANKLEIAQAANRLVCIIMHEVRRRTVGNKVKLIYDKLTLDLEVPEADMFVTG
jgi:hypothetical protein